MNRTLFTIVLLVLRVSRGNQWNTEWAQHLKQGVYRQRTAGQRPGKAHTFTARGVIAVAIEFHAQHKTHVNTTNHTQNSTHIHTSHTCTHPSGTKRKPTLPKAHPKGISLIRRRPCWGLTQRIDTKPDT